MEWSDLFEVAFVEIGLKPNEFWDLTFREFDYIARHKSKEVEREWDIARTLGMWSISPHTKKKVKPKDLLKLPSDKTVQPMPHHQMEAIINKWNNR